MVRTKREIKLALTAIAAVVILIWGISFLKAKALFDQNNVFYGIYDRVDGLKVSSGVVYRGYNVGQVRAINFVGERFDKVLVQFSVEKKLEIPVNTVAAIQNSDLMGSKAINLIPGDAAAYARNGDTLKTQLTLGLMEQLNEQLEPLKRKAENVLVSLDTVLVVLQEIFTDSAGGDIRGSLKSVGRTLEHVEQASGTLNELLDRESGRISDILGHVDGITGNLENSNAEITRSLDNVTSITDSLKHINLNRTVRSLNGLLARTDSIVSRINRGRGTVGGMVNDDELYYNLVAVSGQLNRLLTEFRENPKRFVNLSVFDFGGNRTIAGEPYGIAVAESDVPLALNSALYLEHPDLKEIRKKGKYLYLIRTCRNLRQAQKELKEIGRSFDHAFIVKID